MHFEIDRLMVELFEGRNDVLYVWMDKYRWAN